jgi:hypothetical protein
MVTTCFGKYDRHQVLKYLVGETAAIFLILHMWSLRCARVLGLVCLTSSCTSLPLSFLNRLTNRN